MEVRGIGIVNVKTMFGPASVLPEKASDRTVTWTSSDADAVRVVDGRLEARKITTDPVTITVTTRDGGFHAQCSVQVVTPPDEEYVVSVPKTVKIATIKDDVVIPVTVSNAREDITAFNTFDIALTYDPASLEFVPDTAREGMKVEMGEGTLRILGWGASRRLDPEKAVAFTLTFHPLSMENPFVTIQSARVDFSDNALLANAAQATLHPEYDDVEISYRTEVKIGGYNVTANETLFAVDSYTANGESDFLIRLKDYAHYDYQDVTITIGGIDKTTAVDFDPETGEYTIPKELITGEVHITGRRTPKIYRVTFFRDEGQTRDEAQYNENYTFQVASGYTVEILIDETEYSIEPDANGTYTIPGTAITGDIEIYITRQSDDDDGSDDSGGSGDDDSGNSGTGGSGGSGDDDDSGNSGTGGSSGSGNSGSSVNSGNSSNKNNTTNKNKTTNTTTTTNKTTTTKTTTKKTATETVKADSLEVKEYVTLGKESLYLIVYKYNTSGNVPKYDGQSMYWSKAYDAYVWVTASEQTEEQVAEAVLKKITLASGKAIGDIDYSGDVNMSKSNDIADAKLVWQMYHAQYSMQNMEMQKFLNADVNGDKKLDVRDVVATAQLIS